MRVRAKLIVIILFVALVPLGISAYTTLAVHQRAFDDKLHELHSKTAEYGANQLDRDLNRALHGLTNLTTQTIDWAELTDLERAGALDVIYAQLDDIAVVSLLDSAGVGLGASVYRDVGAESVHPPMSLEGLDSFGRRIPLVPALSEGAAVGEPFAVAGDGAATLPLAFAVAGREGQRWVVAVGLSLVGLCATLERARTPGTNIHLVDAAGRYMCGGAAGSVLGKIDPGLAEALKSDAPTIRYHNRAGTELLAARAGAANGAIVVVEQSAEAALAPSRKIRRQTLLWIALGVIAALLAGWFLAREISRPVARLATAAAAVAERKFDVHLEADGRDEFGELARAFNVMSKEIQQWGETLQQRVDDRTRELKEAQEQLLEARKIGAVASLGAGIAHEINNPLTGVLALTQVLGAKAAKLGDEKQQRLLGSIEKEAQRIKEIVQRTLRLSQDYAGEGFASLPLGKLVRTILDGQTDRFAAAGVEVVFECSEGLAPVLGNGSQLEEALVQLIDNAVKAMTGDNSRLTVTMTEVEGELVKLEMSDTGRGIASEHLDKVFEPFFTTKTEWSGQGLGLSLAYRIVEAHHGNMRIASEVGSGTTVTIRLPVARQGSYLV